MFFFLLLLLLLLLRAARARAPNTPPKTDSKGARARAARNNNKQPERTGVHKHKNHGIYDVFAASEKAKIEDKDSETTKTLYFTMFLACGAKTRVQKSA